MLLFVSEYCTVDGVALKWLPHHVRIVSKCVKARDGTVDEGGCCDRDGDGRSTAQATALKEHLPVDMVMNLDVPREVIMDRLTDRWIHPGSGRVYAYAYRPPKVRV